MAKYRTIRVMGPEGSWWGLFTATEGIIRGLFDTACSITIILPQDAFPVTVRVNGTGFESSYDDHGKPIKVIKTPLDITETPQ